MNKNTAIAVESSDDGGRTWTQHGIHSSPFLAIQQAREIPWEWRLRKMVVTPGDIITDDEVKVEIRMLETLESIFEDSKKL